MNKSAKNKSFALIVVLMLISVVLVFGTSFAASAINENKISRSQTQSIKAYYLSESGIHEALWKLKNDIEWKDNFETNPEWEASIERMDIFYSGSTFKVKIKNLNIGEAEIISSGLRSIGGVLAARRISKLNAEKTIFADENNDSEDNIEESATGSIPAADAIQELNIDNTVLFASEKINLWGMNLESQGDIFSQEDTNIFLWSNIDIQGKAKSCGNINIDANSSLSATELKSLNNPPASGAIAMPAAGFDAEGDSNSFKAIAQGLGQVFTAAQFSELILESPVQNFSGSVYITGNATIGKGANIAINGVLALDGSLIIGDDWQWWNPCSSIDAKIIITSSPDKPSGIFSKNQIIIKTCVGNIDISGIMYAGNSIVFSSISNNFSINGAAISRNIEGTGLWNPVILAYNEEIILNSLRTESAFAPIIDSSYWEN